MFKKIVSAVSNVFSDPEAGKAAELKAKRDAWRKQLAQLPELTKKRFAAQTKVNEVRDAVARAEEFPARIGLVERELQLAIAAEQAAKRCEQQLKDTAPQELQRKHHLACKAEPAVLMKLRDLRNKLPDLEKELKAADELLQTLEQVPRTRTLDALQQSQWESDIRRARFNCGELRNTLGETREQIASAEGELQTVIRERAEAVQTLINA